MRWRKIWNTIDGLDCHIIEFYFYLRILDEDLSSCKRETDAGEKIVWLPLDEIETHNLKPTFLKENIHRIVHEKNNSYYGGTGQIALLLEVEKWGFNALLAFIYKVSI